jgi:hypothetical protein
LPEINASNNSRPKLHSIGSLSQTPPESLNIHAEFGERLICFKTQSV